jgi:polar amino acid transport system substrate-binding protein
VAGIDTHVQSALAPTGRLRAGIAVGSAISATWAKRDAHTGLPFGPTVDLVTIFAARTGLDLTLVEYGSSGEIVKAALAGGWDVSFTPVDEERKTQVDFGPTFALSESTYMVLPGSSISNIDDVDRVGVRVFGVENTATIRAARRSLKNTTAVGLTSLEEVLAKRKWRSRGYRLGEGIAAQPSSKLPGSQDPGWAFSGVRDSCRSATRE